MTVAFRSARVCALGLAIARTFRMRLAVTGRCRLYWCRTRRPSITPGALVAAESPVGLPYAAAEIARRLGISTAVFQGERLGARHVAAVRQLGTERIELVMAPKTFDYQDRRQVTEVLTECRKQGVSVGSVHGNLQRKYNDPVEGKRRAAAAALLDEIRFSEEAGAGILVAHFGTDDPARKTVTELLDETKDLRIRLTVENMGGGLKPYADFVDRIGSERFGLTVDIGHARDPDLRYSDGTPYHQFGTTCYAWIHQTAELQQQTLKTLAASPFNKIRFCVFPRRRILMNSRRPSLPPSDS